MVSDSLTLLNRRRVFEYAAERLLPAIYETDSLTREGGLMSYGPDRREIFERSAALVDRIFKGTKPADLPVEQPTHFPFVLNQPQGRWGSTYRTRCSHLPTRWSNNYAVCCVCSQPVLARSGGSEMSAFCAARGG